MQESLTWRKLLVLKSTSDTALHQALQVLKPYVAKNLWDEKQTELRELVLKWRYNFQRKWKRCGKLAAFLEKENDWLDSEPNIPVHLLRERAVPAGESSRSITRRVARVSSEQKEDHDILLLGTAKTIAKKGTPMSKARARLLRNIAKKKSKALEMVGAVPKRQAFSQRNFTDEEGLKLLLELNLTKAQYITLRKVTNGVGHKDLFPAYRRVKAAKAAARPPPSSFSPPDERGMTVQLSALLQHTCERVIRLQEDCITAEFERSGKDENEARLIVAWGMDGAGNQSKYKQASAAGGFADESHLFIVSIVPVQLCSTDALYWKNPRPQSPLFCRPLRMIFGKENRDFVIRIRNDVHEEIDRLQPIKFKVGNKFT